MSSILEYINFIGLSGKTEPITPKVEEIEITKKEPVAAAKPAEETKATADLPAGSAAGSVELNKPTSGIKSLPEGMASEYGQPQYPNEDLRQIDANINYLKQLLSDPDISQTEKDAYTNQLNVLRGARLKAAETSIKANIINITKKMTDMEDLQNPYLGQDMIQVSDSASKLTQGRIKELEAQKPQKPTEDTFAWKDVVAAMLPQIMGNFATLASGTDKTTAALTASTMAINANEAIAAIAKEKNDTNKALNNMYYNMVDKWQGRLDAAYKEANDALTDEEKLKVNNWVKFQVANKKAELETRKQTLNNYKAQLDAQKANGTISQKDYELKMRAANTESMMIDRDMDNFRDYDKNNLTKAKLIDDFVIDKTNAKIREKGVSMGLMSRYIPQANKNTSPSDNYSITQYSMNMLNNPEGLDNYKAAHMVLSDISTAYRLGAQKAVELSQANTSASKAEINDAIKGIEILKQMVNTNGEIINITGARDPNQIFSFLKTLGQKSSDKTKSIYTVGADVAKDLGLSLIKLPTNEHRLYMFQNLNDIHGNLNNLIGLGQQTEQTIIEAAAKKY